MPEDLTQKLLAILQGDEPDKAEHDAESMIAAAAGYLYGRYGEDAVVALLLDKVEKIRAMTFVGRPERAAGVPLH